MRSGSGRPQDLAATEDWLRGRFGLAALRAGQAEVVFRLLRGERVLFVAPTGWGKSLCYQALAASRWSAGVVLVFTPLKALMSEQVERARAQGLRAALVNSDQEREEQERILGEAASGRLDLLFIAPERLGNVAWRDRVPEMTVKAVVIDEAHCISQWGHDFRPWYRRMVDIVVGLGLRTPVLAVTATAPGQVMADVQSQIAPTGQPVRSIRLPSVRPLLDHAVWSAKEPEQRLALLVYAARKFAGMPGIAYFVTRRDAEQAARLLISLGLSAIAYHAGYSPDEKELRLARWRAGEADLICSTSALGMGVDRADVRWVLHAELPSSLVQYVQEIGRAGRDEQPALAIAIDFPAISAVHQGMLASSAPSFTDYQRVLSAVAGGLDKRTAIVESLDLPESLVQRLLDDLVEGGALQRLSGAPARYARGIGPPPAQSDEARRVRQDLLDAAMAWPASTECRRVSLARAMGDLSLPAPCGRCDRCRPAKAPELASILPEVHGFLQLDHPELPAHAGSDLGAGYALSWYGVGELGRAVSERKRAGRAAPPELLPHALAALQAMDFHPELVVWVPPTRSGAFVEGFARSLAARLGIPAIGLHKVRVTAPQKDFHAHHNKKRNVKDALALDPSGVHQAMILLVDDIWDSGATLREAAKVLRAPGRVVRPLTLARTRHSDDQQ